MKIQWNFADGTKSEVEVNEELGEFITASRREEDNLSRKERYTQCVDVYATFDDSMKQVAATMGMTSEEIAAGSPAYLKEDTRRYEVADISGRASYRLSPIWLYERPER